VDAPRLRPTFTFPLPLTQKEGIEEIRQRLTAREDLAGRWRSKGRWAEIFVADEDKKLWSPHVSIRVDHADEGCTLFGRFAPHPEVWTFFMFVYFAVVFFVVFGGTFGYVQWVSNEPAWGLWSVWLGVPILAGLHLASWMGQRLGQGQMAELKALLEAVMDDVLE
jgi:hypothetical protein